MRQTQLVIEKRHRQYLKDGQISGFCRNKIEKLKSEVEQDSSVNYPTNQRRRYDHRFRTSVLLRMDQAQFVKEISLTFSHYIQNQIQEQIDQESSLQELENNPGPLISPNQRELMRESRSLHSS
jgi:ribosomal protein L20